MPSTTNQSEKMSGLSPSAAQLQVKQNAEINPYLKQILQKFRRAFKAVVIFSFFINLLMLSVPLYLLHIYSKVLPNHSTDTLFLLTTIVLVSIVALAALESLRRAVLIKLGTWFEKNVGEHLLASTIVHSLQNNSGKSANIIRDLSQLRSFMGGNSLISILDLPWTPIYIIFLYFLHPLIGSLAIGAALLLFILAYVNEISTRGLVRTSQQASRKSMDSATSYARNADVIEAMGMRSQILNKWGADKDHALSLSTRANSINARITAVVKFIRLLLQVSVIGLAAWLILQGELSPGATIASVLLMRRAVAPLENSISSWKSVLKAREAFVRINRYLDRAPTLKRSPPMPPPDGQLTVEKISYKHPNVDKPIFRQVSFSINPGEAAALVGSTAAGKTTLARILTGLKKPSSGNVRLGGFDLSQWSSEQRGPVVGYLPQDVELFSGTVRENIARMQEGEISQIIEAAKMANVHDIIQKFPQGYETEIGENGAYLSGGQRQRVGLARALYGDPKLIILDEPDANLDTHGRAALAIAIQKLKRKGAIVLLITHHGSAKQFVDKVFELKNGSIPVERKEKKTAKLRVVRTRKRRASSSFVKAR